MSPCNSIAGLYFEGTCDIISVTMAMHKVHTINYLKLSKHIGLVM